MKEDKLIMANSGQFGGVHEAGTTALTGTWLKIHCLTATTFATLTSNITGDALTGIAHPEGTILYGIFTAITLTSGEIIAYNAVPY
jgi:hypothetical protein